MERDFGYHRRAALPDEPVEAVRKPTTNTPAQTPPRTAAPPGNTNAPIPTTNAAPMSTADVMFMFMVMLLFYGRR